MALTATIYKATLQISDLDRGYYAAHHLTLARHPSETDQRLMVRLLAFALHADDALTFGRGVSNADEPALWQHQPNGDIALWIEIGQPDPERLRKACGRAHKVLLLSYGGSATTLWWQKHQQTLQRFGNLEIRELAQSSCEQLTNLAQRNMQLNCTIQDGDIWLGDDQQSVELQLSTLKPSDAS